MTPVQDQVWGEIPEDCHRQGDAQSWCVLSNDERYRYALGRTWTSPLIGDGTTMVFCMLNPSKADGLEDDPTIRKCIGFADRHGANAILVVNLFAWRETKPKLLPRDHTVVGPHQLPFLSAALNARDTINVAAWGALSAAHRRLSEPSRRFVVGPGTRPSALKCLGLTQSGDPCHPLMLPYATPLVDYAPREP